MPSKAINNIDNLCSTIKEFENFTDTLLILCNKNLNRKQKYKGNQLNASEINVNKITESYLENLLKVIKKRRMENFDLEVSCDETVQILSNSLITEREVIEKIITNDEKISPPISKEVNFDSFDFVINRIVIAENEDCKKQLTLFRKYNKLTTNFKNSYKYHFVGKEIKELTSKILSFDGIVDAFELDGYYYVLNRNAFNSIFNYTDVFERIIEDNTDLVCKYKLFSEPEKFINDCKNDGRYIKRLTKVILGKGFDNLEKNKAKLNDIKKKCNLNIEINSDNIIVYHGKDDINVILNLLLEHYVISALTNNVMLAKAIEKYEMKG